MCAVRMNNASRSRGATRAGGIDLAMQCHGFAGAVATDLLTCIVKSCKTRRVKKAQASIGRRYQIAAALLCIQFHADIASGGMHVAAVKQAFANAAYFFSRLYFSQFTSPDLEVSSWPATSLPSKLVSCSASFALKGCMIWL